MEIIKYIKPVFIEPCISYIIVLLTNFI